MFKKRVAKREACTAVQRQFDQNLAAAMFLTAPRRAAVNAGNALAVTERDLKPLMPRPHRGGTIDHVQLFSIDLLGSWMKP